VTYNRPCGLLISGAVFPILFAIKMSFTECLLINVVDMAGKGGRRPTTTFRKFYVEINNDEGGKKMKCTLKKIIEMPDDQAPIEEDCNWVTEVRKGK